LGQALNNGGLHSQWLVDVLQRNIMFFDICSFSSVIKQQSSEDVLSFFTVMVRNRQRGASSVIIPGAESDVYSCLVFVVFNFLGTVIVYADSETKHRLVVYLSAQI